MGIKDVVKNEFGPLFDPNDLEATQKRFQSRFDQLESDDCYGMRQVKLMAKTIKSNYKIIVNTDSQKLYRLLK